MTSTFDILTTAHEAVSAAISSTLTGNVFLFNVPDGEEQKENVVLNVLVNPGTYVQDGIMNVNLEMLELEKGRPNSVRMKEIMDLIVPVFDQKTIRKGDGSVTLHTEIDRDMGLFKDRESSQKYFYNLRVRFVTL